MEVWLGNAYNRWLIDRILSEDDRIKSLIFLPYNTPQEAERTVKELADKKGVIGFCEGFRMPSPWRWLQRTAGAGVRKPPREETALKGT